MRIAILDPAAGISGDMTLGALLSLGVPGAWLKELPARLGVGDVRVTVRDVRRSGITCKQVEFDIPEQPRNEIEILYVKRMDELLPLVLTEMPKLGVLSAPSLPPASAPPPPAA